MEKLFTIEYDSTLVYWDYKLKTYIVRPYTYELLDILMSMGKVSIYSNSSLCFPEMFLYDLYVNPYNTKMPANIFSSVDPLLAYNEYDILNISGNPLNTNVASLPIKGINIVPSHIGYLVKNDIELLILGNYLSYKIDSDTMLKEHSFDDWGIRIEKLYSKVKSKIL